MMDSIITIFRKELRGYFASPIAYVVAAIFWLLAGFFFVTIVGRVIQFSQQADMFGGGQSFDAVTIASQQFLGVLGTLMLFVLPILTMGLYAEERRRGTMELLATSPVSNFAVALGKWLGVLVFFATILLPILVYQVLSFSASNPTMNFRLMIFGYLGLLLLAGCIMALGLFVSSLTDSTLIAALGSFGLVLLLWVVDAAAGEDTSPAAALLRHISLLQQYNTWVQGSVNLSSLVLFVSVITFGLFLTVQSVEALRWQRS